MGELQLPWDFTRTPSTGYAPERFDFELVVPSIADIDRDALVIAAFAIGLHRHSGQTAIPLDVCGRDGVLRGVELEVAGTTCRALARAANPDRPPLGTGAVITWSTMVDADLVLALDGERAAFVYNAKLFKRSTIERLAGHLGVVMRVIEDHIERPISTLPLLPPSETQWLEAMGTGRQRALRTPLVHQMFEYRAASKPAATALRYRDRQLSYDVLNRRANQLAHALAKRGLGADARIVVCVEPSFDIAIALLGILKAGAIYIPLDPTYPAARIGAILEDTRPDLIISNGYLIDKLALGDAIALDAGALDGLPETNLDLATEPERTAYVYFTSGTTGKPKGILASHSNLHTYIEVARERYAIDHRDVMPAIARFSFSISMFELMSPLVAGGTLVILDRDHILAPERMAKTLSEVTFFHAGPSLLKHLLPYLERSVPDLSVFDRVRHASSGGDMIPPEVLESLKRIFRTAEVFVIYGCSEISCMGCTYPVPRDAVVDRTYVGRPFDNVLVRIFDPAGNHLPIGAVGEIHFAGGGIVKGYLDRPELTAERFVEIDGHRFYRTGDMGRVSDDGWVEILGRNDFQIKIRGMRIELGEVEYNLRRAPGVRDAVVMAKTNPAGDKVMVGYVVFGDGGPDRLAAVRRHMVDSVPDYMVPATYVELDKLPVNHNLKVDRYALPEPTFERGTMRPPETLIEQRLAAIWKAVLGVSQVGLDDNFFDLGADSLLAMEMMTRADRELRTTIDGMDVLRETLEVLAAICERQLGKVSAKAPRARSAQAQLETFYFDGLYGVLHGGKSSDAVLICPPIGQEATRAHFILNRVGSLLAARGTPVMRFDYYGTGDSEGSSVDATPGRWQRDIASARAELVRKTGATRITGIGARLGATLLATAGIAASLVLWDPIVRAEEWYDEQAELHRRYLRSQQDLRRGRRPLPPRGGEERLGMTYSPAAAKELPHLAIPRFASPVKWLATHDAAHQAARFDALGGKTGFEALDVDCGWRDLARFEDLIPDVGIAHALVAMVTT